MSRILPLLLSDMAGSGRFPSSSSFPSIKLTFHPLNKKILFPHKKCSTDPSPSFCFSSSSSSFPICSGEMITARKEEEEEEKKAFPCFGTKPLSFLLHHKSLDRPAAPVPPFPPLLFWPEQQSRSPLPLEGPFALHLAKPSVSSLSSGLLCLSATAASCCFLPPVRCPRQ